MKELQPINQNVLLELTEDSSEQKTAAGIIIPDSAKEQQIGRASCRVRV